MSGKYAFYLPYKVIDSLSNGNVSDSEFREFIMGLVEYDRTGMFPASHTAGFAMMFELLKPDLNFAKAKYEDIIQKRREAGEKGGAPKGNKNAAGNRGGGAPKGNRNAVREDSQNEKSNNKASINISNSLQHKDLNEPENKHNQMLEFENKHKQNNQNQTNQAKQADISNQLSDIRISSSSEVVLKKQPLTTTDLFTNSCKEAGFPIDEKTAIEIQKTGIDPSWFSGAFTFPEYIAEVIQKNYHDKPKDEKRRLFRNLILEAEEKKADFPDWRNAKEIEAAAQEEQRRKEIAAEKEQRRIEEARKNPPINCAHCGKPVNKDGERYICPQCGHGYFFNEETGTWENTEPIELKSVLSDLEKRVSTPHLPEPLKIPPEHKERYDSVFSKAKEKGLSDTEAEQAVLAQIKVDREILRVW